MSFYLKVFSKDEKVLYQFIQFFSKLKTLLIILKFLPEQKKRKIFTILKSPHVNKTAQEQFEFRIFNCNLLLDPFKQFSFLLLLKKIKNVSFSGLKLELKTLMDTNKNVYKRLKAVNPDRVYLSVNFFNVKKKGYIQLFDCYGELCLKNLLASKKAYR